jgi:hypothetical protein
MQGDCILAKHRPAQLWRKDQAACAYVCSAGRTASDALKLSVGIHFHDLPNGFGQRVDGPRGLGRQGHLRYPPPFPRGCSLTKLLSLTPLALQRNR